jgi:hypothetical protein
MCRGTFRCSTLVGFGIIHKCQVSLGENPQGTNTLAYFAVVSVLRKKLDNNKSSNQYNKQISFSLLRKKQNKLERLSLSSHFILVRKEPTQWKRISCKQNARWQHLSQSKAGAFFSLKKNLVITKHYNLYLGLVTPSSGRWSLIGAPFSFPGLTCKY